MKLASPETWFRGKGYPKVIFLSFVVNQNVNFMSNVNWLDAMIIFNDKSYGKNENGGDFDELNSFCFTDYLNHFRIKRTIFFGTGWKLKGECLFNSFFLWQKKTYPILYTSKTFKTDTHLHANWIIECF